MVLFVSSKVNYPMPEDELYEDFEYHAVCSINLILGIGNDDPFTRMKYGLSFRDVYRSLQFST